MRGNGDVHPIVVTLDALKECKHLFVVEQNCLAGWLTVVTPEVAVLIQARMVANYDALKELRRLITRYENAAKPFVM